MQALKILLDGQAVHLSQHGRRALQKRQPGESLGDPYDLVTQKKRITCWPCRLERSFGEDLNLKESLLHLNLIVPGWLPLASFALIIHDYTISLILG